MAERTKRAGTASGAAGFAVAIPPGASMLVKTGFYEGLEVCIDREWVVVGRGRSADVILAEPTISRSHAAIGFDESGFFVQDLGSTNGTMLNGALLASRHEGQDTVARGQLKSGDAIQMGKLVIHVTLPS